MIHKTRTYGIAEVADAETLAEKLTENSWTLCTGFRLGPLLFLNDSFSEDGAQEWTVVRDGVEVESITFGWCSYYKALQYICELEAGGGGQYGTVAVRTDHAYPCHLCA